MKAKHLIIVIAFVIIIDQLLKFYIKLNYYPGEEHKVIGSWFRLHFIENEGMAWGWSFGGGFGKIALTLFRLVAVIAGTFLLRDFIRKKYHWGFITCAGLIYAGALGNLIDSMFYGLIFDTSFNRETFENAGVVAKAFTNKHYGTFLHGKVVDMLYFPLVETTYPSWFPFVGGKPFEFFAPVFNIADASISIGVFIIFIFQNKFFKKENETVTKTVETKALANDETQIL